MSDSLDYLEIGVGLVGGLALFLYGMHTMSEGLKAAAGNGMTRLFVPFSVLSAKLASVRLKYKGLAKIRPPSDNRLSGHGIHR